MHFGLQKFCFNFSIRNALLSCDLIDHFLVIRTIADHTQFILEDNHRIKYVLCCTPILRTFALAQVE